MGLFFVKNFIHFHLAFWAIDVLYLVECLPDFRVSAVKNFRHPLIEHFR